MIYSNFFSPPIISILFCLHESTVEGQQKDPRNETVQFMIKKILTITQHRSLCLTNQQFEAEMLSVTNNMTFLDKYRQSIAKITTFNDFYREVSKILKTLRSLRNNKLEQGNLIDFLVRRMYIYFQKLDFKQIIKIYQQFQDFKNGIEVTIGQHEFMLTKSIQELKFNLQNYGGGNPEEITMKVNQLSQYDHTQKTSYLKSLARCDQHIPIESINSMHRYFDKSLGNLFQEKSEVNLMSNKINHCILSNAYINLRMNFLQQCLQSISQGLRISQNNNDEESINNCIIYLYKISEQLGKYEEQILLNQHAITHSLNLNNIVLMAYSCFNYSLFETKYNCNDPNILLMKNRNISWTDALHFSKKKIYSTFQSNCKNIYHTHRSLLIPSFMTKLSVLLHLPQLKSLLINPYYQRHQLFQLEIYKQFQASTKAQEKIDSALRKQKTNRVKLIQRNIQELLQLKSKALSPLQIIKIRLAVNKLKVGRESQQLCFIESEKLAEFCQLYGFIKEEWMQATILSVNMLLSTELYYQALLKIEVAEKKCINLSLADYLTYFRILKVKTMLHLNRDINEIISLLRQLQAFTKISKIRTQSRIAFHEAKYFLNKKVYEIMNVNSEFAQQCEILKGNQLNELEKLLQLYLQSQDFKQVKSSLQKLSCFELANASIKGKKEKTKQCLAYVSKILGLFASVDTQDYSQAELDSRIAQKIKKIYFGA